MDQQPSLRASHLFIAQFHKYACEKFIQYNVTPVGPGITDTYDLLIYDMIDVRHEVYHQLVLPFVLRLSCSLGLRVWYRTCPEMITGRRDPGRFDVAVSQDTKIPLIQSAELSPIDVSTPIHSSRIFVSK